MSAAVLSGSACGPGGGVCGTRIYPSQVIKSVRQQIKTLTLDPPKGDEDSPAVQVPEHMELDERMKAANWKDAAMVELSIQQDNVREIDVLRSREMVQRHAGDYGSICLVVRRPG